MKKVREKDNKKANLDRICRRKEVGKYFENDQGRNVECQKKL